MSTINSSYLSFGQQNAINMRASAANAMFGSLPATQNNMLGNYTLSDYSSLKNGSYGKLLKAVYAKEKAESEGTSSSRKANDPKTVEKTSYEKSGKLEKLLSTYKEEEKEDDSTKAIYSSDGSKTAENNTGSGLDASV